ncbi:WecB/TagA/CpsF family glycosyltransferase [Paenibacillus thermoaerophilus]|uniref:N-acetylglucosaminyldiphosphoundecaprenol N-acetyl-beta-D-mannosaminyltransferase n=1 Tax=Paenibacillus thermoaerophilus TaxID=1215385 RepID=A0ABW2V4W4_9BACL|nr:WecB/TagA/CpsF family glycosyltransferase [Paenibacillus thermoaerophilus]TMV12509.1 WecB/TagA/CpsF family glycosyltransferase [Paenibacillus thermoaerophilus]
METVRIFGIPVAKMNKRETVEYLTRAVEQKKPHHVVTINPIMIMAALEHPAHMAVMKRAELVIPDGAGVVWAAGYVGNPVKERVPGIEVMGELLAVAEQRGWRVYLVGAAPEVIAAAVERMRAVHPKLQIVGYRDGYFGEAEDEAVVEDIRRAAPDLLFVGRSAATQEPWIDKYKERLSVPVMMGVGGSFDVWSGRIRRAPAIFRKLHLEWLHRLLREPSRFPRMLALPKFALKVIREKENVQKP